MTDRQEQNWIDDARRGDQEAFAQLVHLYEKRVYALTLRMCKNPADAEEAAQEAFLAAWQGLAFFRGESSFSTWLYRLASNVCLDHLRSRKRSQTVPLVVACEDSEVLAVDLPDPAPLPEEQVVLSEERKILQAALESLAPEERRLLTLRVVNDLSYAEIAALLEIKEGTVKSRLSRARERLRKKFLKLRNETDFTSSKQRKGG